MEGNVGYGLRTTFSRVDKLCTDKRVNGSGWLLSHTSTYSSVSQMNFESSSAFYYIICTVSVTQLWYTASLSSMGMAKQTYILRSCKHVSRKYDIHVCATGYRLTAFVATLKVIAMVVAIGDAPSWPVVMTNGNIRRENLVISIRYIVIPI